MLHHSIESLTTAFPKQIILIDNSEMVLDAEVGTHNFCESFKRGMIF